MPCFHRLMLIAVLLAAQSLSDAAPAAAALGANAPQSTSQGATFTAPAGWTVNRGGALSVLQPPEPDTHIAIVDVGPAADAAAAVAAAWTTYRPDAKLAFKLATPRPPRNGWEERQVFDYETSPNERLVLQAVALRHGTAWTVLLLDGTEPTFEKRGAPIALISQSLRPAGYARETFAGRTPNKLDAARIEALKSFVQDSMAKLGVPGASIALTEGNTVLFEGGFGVRELGRPVPVDANTLFMAASNTKGMATLLLAQLADQGKLQWSQPVTEIYPAFKLGDAQTTAKVRVEHLVCACTGLPRQDFEWLFEFKKATAASSLALLGTMKPTSQFGEVFQYSNLMASAAGYIGGHLVYPKLELGAAFDKAMQTQIFDPLGMKATTFDMARVLRSNHASPHSLDMTGQVGIGRMDFNYSITPHRPAGGVWTSAHDLIRYVQLELSQGLLADGQRIVSAENLLARRKPGIADGEDRMYGMGLETDRSWGVPVVYHGGSMAGYKSNLYVLPDANIGAVLLTNSDQGGRLLRPFLRRLLELLYDGKPEAEADVASQASSLRAALAKERERLVIPAAAAEVTALARHYVSPELGRLDVKRDGRSGTVFDFGEWHSTVASRKNDDASVSFVTVSPTLLGFEFVVGPRAGGQRVLITRDGQHEYVFTER